MIDSEGVVRMWALLITMMEQVIALATAGFVEGTGIPWPGSLIMATAGMTAGGDWRSVLILVLVFSTTYTLGALIQYAAGWALGPVALSWLTKPQRARLQGLMERYGFGMVCWSRPLAIGNYVSIPAGMLRMNPIRFGLYTFLGAVPWAVGTIVLGRLLGSRLPLLQAQFDRWMLPALGLLALAAVAASLYRRRRLLCRSESA